MAPSWPHYGEPNNINTINKLTSIETQISVDPTSLKERNSPGVTFSKFDTPTNVKSGFHKPQSLPPSNSKFLSVSLPNSASSSPQFSSRISIKKSKCQTQEPPISPPSKSNFRQSDIQKSKSCGGGRANAPSDDFDHWLTKVNSIESNLTTGENKRDTCKKGKGELDKYEEEFKCGALCLYLPGFGRGKPVKERKKETNVAHVISRTVSLEKFECGSWTSSAMVNDREEDEDVSKHYFDLPIELIKCSASDTNSPVRASFMFDNDRKGVLKNNSTRVGRKSYESSRHVRFSTSSPITRSPSTSPCITPRLRKAREDFNAFLEAQIA